MFKIAVLVFLATALAKIKNPKYDYILFESSNSVVEPKFGLRQEPIEKAWVLSLIGDVDNLKLRPATRNEVREVFSASPLHVGDNPRQGKVIKKDDPTKPAQLTSSAAPEQSDADDKATIIEIMRMINKFALSTNTDPDAYLKEDTNESPNVKLYFKGILTSLVVEVKGKQWHYIIRPPTLFPEWFYEDHTSVSRDSRGAFVEVPRNVKMEFFSVLLHVLTTFSGFPI